MAIESVDDVDDSNDKEDNVDTNRKENDESDDRKNMKNNKKNSNKSDKCSMSIDDEHDKKNNDNIVERSKSNRNHAFKNNLPSNDNHSISQRSNNHRQRSNANYNNGSTSSHNAHDRHQHENSRQFYNQRNFNNTNQRNRFQNKHMEGYESEYHEPGPSIRSSNIGDGNYYHSERDGPNRRGGFASSSHGRPSYDNRNRPYYASKDYDEVHRWDRDRNEGRFRHTHNHLDNGSEYSYNQHHFYQNNSGYVRRHGIIDERISVGENNDHSLHAPSNMHSSITGIVVENKHTDNQTPLSSICNDTYNHDSILTGSTGNKFVILKQVCLSKDDSVSTMKSSKRKHSLMTEQLSTDNKSPATKQKPSSPVLSVQMDDIPQTSKATKRKKNKKQKKRLRMLILNTLIVKGEIDDEEYINKQINLNCINNPTVNRYGKVTNVRFKDVETEMKDANKNNVVWEIFIEGTRSMIKDFTTRQLIEAIETTQEKRRYTIEIYERKTTNDGTNECSKEKEPKEHNHSKKKETNQRNKNKHLSSAYHETCNKRCTSCNVYLPESSFLESVNKSNKFSISYLELDDTILCPNCCIRVSQTQKMNSKNLLLYKYLRDTICSKDHSWDNTPSRLIPSNDIVNHLLPSINSDEPILRKLREIIKIKVLVVDKSISDKKYKTRIEETKGGVLLEYKDYEEINNKSMELPEDGTVGVVIFPSANNFLIIDESYMTNDEILEVGRKESHSISKIEYGARSGPAGGTVFPDSNSHSLCEATKTSNSIFVAHTNGSGMSIEYINNEGEKKRFSSVYNDILMQRLTKSKKRKKMLYEKTLRDTEIKEMTSRMKGYIIASHLDLLPDKNINPFEKLVRIYNRDPKFVNTLSLFMNMGYTLLEASLLVWSCSSGEMRNHQAMAAHVDGNKTHQMETLSLFSRESSKALLSNCNLINKDTDGFLYFPIDGLVIRIKCGKNFIHSYLTNTLHIPDLSRNTMNWSRVHGP